MVIAPPLLPNPTEIPRFSWVESWLARGAQPSARGWRWLADEDFRIAVNLRRRNEARAATRANPQLNCIHIPVSNNAAPTDEQALRWLQICKANRRKDRTFIHCGMGEGRTSLFCALLRIAQGWSLDQALLEERTFGFKPRGEHKAQAAYLADFVRRAEAGEIVLPNLQTRR